MKLFISSEDIFERYQNYDLQMDLKNIGFTDASILLDININELEYFSKECQKEIYISAMEYRKAKLLSFFMIDVPNPECFHTDREILKQELNYGNCFIDYQRNLKNIFNRSNYLEVIRFSEFCRESFLLIDTFMEQRRKFAFYNIEHDFDQCYDVSMVRDVLDSLNFFQQFYDQEFIYLQKDQKRLVKSSK